ncbi:MAG TPA: hypothetical protein VNK51_07125 [Bradyrhizobium sp.]|nr:hypothetical protein [Bradyrhizobium sp.]
MATPNMRNLFERFLQIYGGQIASTEPMRPESRYQSAQPAYSASSDVYGSDGYTPSGGVLRGWNSPAVAAPWWAGALAGPSGMPVGLRGPRPGGRIGAYPFPPMPRDPNDVVQIPNPHLERLIPQSTRAFWDAAARVPEMVRRQWLEDESSSATREEETGASPPKPPTNRPGSQPPWIVGPAILKEFERQGRTSNQDPQPKEIVDPNFRRLTRFLGSEGDQIVIDNSLQPAGEEKPGQQPATPLPEDHLDIPLFLRRQADPEAAKSEKKSTDLPSVSVGGAGHYGGNRGGGGGGGRRFNEECRKEWKRAHEVCLDAFQKGIVGDIFKRWKSDFATGPFDKLGEPWDINDCKRGFVSKDCGGNAYEEPPPPKVAQAIGRKLVRQDKERRAQEKAKRQEILEEFKRTGKWRFRGR